MNRDRDKEFVLLQIQSVYTMECTEISQGLQKTGKKSKKIMTMKRIFAAM